MGRITSLRALPHLLVDGVILTLMSFLTKSLSHITLYKGNTSNASKGSCNMLTKAVKITSKGQATIPKEIRDLLNTDVVEFEVVDGTVVVKPVLSIGGSLNRYAKGSVSITDVREKVWEEVAREKSGKNPA